MGVVYHCDGQPDHAVVLPPLALGIEIDFFDVVHFPGKNNALAVLDIGPASGALASLAW